MRMRGLGMPVAILRKGEQAAKGPPTEIRIFRAGINKTTKGSFLFDAEAAAAVMAAFTQYGNELCFDLGHSIPDPSVSVENKKAVGWFTLEVRETDDGPELWAINCRWKKEVAQEIADEEWGYVSPWFYFDESNGRVLEIINCALTNVPATFNAFPLREAADRRTAQLEVGFNTIQSALRSALVRRYGIDPSVCFNGPWIVEVYNDRVVYEMTSKLWQIGYQIVGETAVLQGDPQQVEIQYVPVAQQQFASAVAFKSGPIDSSAGWSGKAAATSVRNWATGEDGKLDLGKYSRAFAAFDAEKPESLDSYKLIHHEVQGGKLVVSRAGCIAAANALEGARGGVDLPEADMKGARDHIGKHYADMEMSPPWEAKASISQPQGAVASTGRASAKETSIMDKAFLSALGLAENAPETEALAKLTRLAADVGELCKLTGKDNPSEALGVATAWKSHAEQLPAAQKQVADLQSAARKAEVTAILDGAPTKVTEAMKPSLLAARPFDKDDDVAWLKAHVEALPTIAALDKANKPNPPATNETGANTAALTHNGKTYEQLSHMEKDALYRSDKATFDALRADSAKRTGK